MRVFPKLGLLLIMPLLLSANLQREPDKDTTSIIQASYIYNIAKLVAWKEPRSKNGPFIIGVMGSPNLYQELIKKYALRSIGKQPIEVRNLPRSPDVDECHIIFVSKEERDLMPALFKQVIGRSTLIITEYPGALGQGAVVNFIPAENTLKYEISLKNANKHGLDIGLTLKQLADRIED